MIGGFLCGFLHTSRGCFVDVVGWKIIGIINDPYMLISIGRGSGQLPGFLEQV